MMLIFIKRNDFECNWKIWFWILLKDMIFNVIKRYKFEFYQKIWFWIPLKDVILNYIERYDFKFHKKLMKNIKKIDVEFVIS